MALATNGLGPTETAQSTFSAFMGKSSGILARMRQGNFFAELKRRNVYKVAVAYMIVAWLLIQGASIFFPTFEAPSWVMKVFIAIVVLGFPAALILAWAFDLTPEGLKRTKTADL